MRQHDADSLGNLRAHAVVRMLWAGVLVKVALQELKRQARPATLVAVEKSVCSNCCLPQ